MKPHDKSSSKKKWNVLVYLGGDNNLSEEMVWSLQEMKKACSETRVFASLNLAVLFDPKGDNPRRYDIAGPGERRPDPLDGDLTSYTSEKATYGEGDVLRIVREYVARECLEALGFHEAGTERQRELARWLLETENRSTKELASSLDVKDPSESSLARVEEVLGPQLADGLRFVSKNATVSALVDHFLSDRILELPSSSGYAVILSGHGSGAVGDFLPDNDPKSTLSIPLLRAILRRAKKSLESKHAGVGRIGILGMDSCQMSTIEVGYEVQDSVDYLVASEGTILNAGWPYFRILEAIAASDSPGEAANGIAEAFVKFYRDYEVAGQSTDIAVCELSRIGRPDRTAEKVSFPPGSVARSIRELAVTMRALLEKLAPDGLEEGIELGYFDRQSADPDVEAARYARDAIVLAHWSAQSYKCDRYVDLYDFCEQLSRYCGARRASDRTGLQAWSERIQALSTELKNAIEDATTSATTGADFQHSHGLSIYFPWSAEDYFPEYRNLDFAQDTGWADFLETYLKATMRMRRLQPEFVVEAAPGRGLVRSEGRAILPLAPERRPETSLMAVTSDTTKDVEAGTHKGQVCAETMKNPPDGFYGRKR